MNLFMEFVINSFAIGILSFVYLLIKRIVRPVLSPNHTYFTGLIIIALTAFPFGILLPKRIQNTISDITSEIPPIMWAQNRIDNTGKMSIISIIWLVVFVIIVLIAIIRHIRFVCDTKKWKEPSLLQSKNMRKVTIYTCPIVSTPTLVGFFKQELIIPPVIKDNDVLDLLCLHEQIHRKRHDNLLRAMMVIIAAMNWFNPLIWLMVREINDDCEISCDRIAKNKMSDDQKNEYCHLMLDLMKRSIGQTVVFSMFSSDYKLIKRRIKAVNSGVNHRAVSYLFCLVVVSLLLAVVVMSSSFMANTNKTSLGDSEVADQGNGIQEHLLYDENNDLYTLIASEKGYAGVDYYCDRQ